MEAAGETGVRLAPGRWACNCPDSGQARDQAAPVRRAEGQGGLSADGQFEHSLGASRAEGKAEPVGPARPRVQLCQSERLLPCWARQSRGAGLLAASTRDSRIVANGRLRLVLLNESKHIVSLTGRPLVVSARNVAAGPGRSWRQPPSGTPRESGADEVWLGFKAFDVHELLCHAIAAVGDFTPGRISWSGLIDFFFYHLFLPDDLLPENTMKAWPVVPPLSSFLGASGAAILVLIAPCLALRTSGYQF